MEYLTAEEEYELQYMDELEMLNEMEFSESDNMAKVTNSLVCHGENKMTTSDTQDINVTKATAEVTQLPISSKRALDDEDEENNSNDLSGDNMAKVANSLVCHDENDMTTSDAQDINVIKTTTKVTQLPISSKRALDYEDEENNSNDLSVIKKCKFYDQANSKSRKHPDTVISSAWKFSKLGDNHCAVPLPITRIDGTTIYLDLYEDYDIQVLGLHKCPTKLLSKSITDLKMELLRKDSLEAAARENSVNSSSQLQASKVAPARKVSAKRDLWVEKYKPKHFTELLSDAGVNRVLLHWLKLWDKVVFGKEVKTRREKPKPALQKKPFHKFRKPGMELNEDLDEHGRPMQKIVLLCGPPGLGKTTLAGVIAQHAGYNVVELNASDDRSPEIFRRCLEASTQMKAVLDPDSRPNCLVIDEIDGTPAPSVELLVSFVKSLGYSKGKRKKGDIPLLQRPVICICNDQYVPALKSLRQVALILNFPPTSKNRLISRLYEVAQMERLKTDLISLDILCEKANNDIRSCLSTIQFLCSFKKEMRSSDVMKVEIGLKDIHKSLFSVWHDVFHVPKEDDGRIRIDYVTNKAYVAIDDASLKKRFSQTLRTVQGFGEYEKLFIGMFENYLNIKLRLTSLEILHQGPEWLCFSDIIQQQIWQNQLFLLMPYLPYVGVAFNLLYASSFYPRLSYPSTFYNCRSKRTQLLNLLSTVIKEVIASAKNFFDVNNLILDILPMLVEILKPNIRPINPQLYNVYEKAEMKRVVNLMVSLHLSYRQERSPDGQYDYILEPTIDNIVTFSGLTVRKPLCYTTKQLVSHEVTLQKLRKKCAMESSNINKRKEAEAAKEVVKPIKINKTQKMFCDYFGRKIEKQEKAVEIFKVTSNTKKVNDDVWYHFNEGFSNGLKKTMRVKDFL